METQKFKEALEPLKETLGKLDRLMKEAGEHFNEPQMELAAGLLSKLEATAGDACREAEKALNPEPPTTFEAVENEEQSEEDDDKPQPVGQSGTLLGDQSSITRQAAESIEKHLADKKPKTNTGIEANATSAPQPGVKTEETGERTDMAEGDKVGLASSEADLSEHFTKDGSRAIEDAAKTEGEKTLTADTAPQRNPLDAGTNDKTAAEESLEGGKGTAHTFTASITGDQPADTAAVASGAQEVLPINGNPAGESGVIVEKKLVEPADAGVLIERPIDTSKTSGDGKDGGDWTAMGMDKDGFPVPKGSAEDVTSK